jgi:hypothetical protein
MDAEIHAAAGAGLKYWAFGWYPPESSFRTAWNLYRQSRYRNLINYCGLVGLNRLGSLPFSNGHWRANVREWAHYMLEQNYQKLTVVGEQRPLLYILWNESDLQRYFDDDVANVRMTVDYLRQSLFDLGMGAAYVVVLDGTAGAPIMREIGADAISNYISSFRRETRGPYVDLDRQTRDFWTTLAETGAPVVPIAMIGWDTRARQERPVPWDHGTPNSSPTQYYELPTPTEFSAHFRAAVDFIKTHPEACPSKALLIYSWDECDEGGGLIPTLGDPKGSCLSAIGAVIDGTIG